MLLIFMIALNVSVAISEKVMIVGFENYQFKGTTLNFDILLKKSDDFKKYTSLEFNAEVTNDTSSNNFTMNCKLSDSYENEENDLSYSCENKIISIQNIKSVKVVPNFFFSNETVNITLTTNNGIKLSSLANNTINNITTETGNLDYKTFTLKSINFKDDEFTFNGKLNTNSTDESAFLVLSEKNITCSVSNTSIKLPMKSNYKINDTLHGKMADKADGSKILIFVENENVYDSVVYPRPSLNYDIELLGVGKFKTNTTNQNATAKAYLRGPSSSLSSLKDYLKFTATINSSQNFTAIGTKNNTKEMKDIIIYDIDFPSTENKTIENITIQKDFVFSDDKTFSSTDTDSPTIIYPSEVISDSDIFNIDNFKVFTPVQYEQAVYRNNFSLLFPLPDGINKIYNKTNANLSYIPYDETSKENKKIREEITNCKIYSYSTSNYYTIKCRPKKSFTTYVNTIKFIVNGDNLTSSKLRFLQSTKNKTFAVSADAIGNITHTYEEQFINRKRSSKGLNAGAIVAIVLASLAAVVAVGLAIFLLSRRPPLPPNKNVVSNIENSTSKIS